MRQEQMPENLCSDDDAFSREYFVYFKRKRLNQGTNYPADAAAVLYIDASKKGCECESDKEACAESAGI